jgi:hypothetical protein
VGARLIVNAHANLDFAFGDEILRHTAARNVDVLQRRTNGDQILIGELYKLVNLFQ